MGVSKVGWWEVGDILEFEKRFQEKLVEQLKEIKRSYRFGDAVIEDVTTSWRIGGREPDITVFVQGQPFLIIECKRALEYSSWDDFPIGQAYTYALLAKREGYTVDFIATANQYFMAFFRVPDDLEKYVNWGAIKKREYDRAFKRELYLKAKYGDLYVGDISYYLVPSKEKLYSIIKRLIEERREIKPEPFRYRMIRRLKSFVDYLSNESKDLIRYRIEKDLKDKFEEIRRRRGTNLTYEQISKEFAYTLMNRVLFYKVLERS